MLCTAFATLVLALGHGHNFNLSSPGLLSFRGLEPRFNLLELPVFMLIGVAGMILIQVVLFQSILIFTPVCVAGGLYGAIFSHTYMIISKARPKWKSLKLLEAILVVIVAVGTSVLLPIAIGKCQS